MRRPAGVPRLHVVTVRAILADPHFAARAEAVLREGGERVVLHLRGPGVGGEKLFRIAGRLRPIADECGALLAVNDRLDVALAIGADAVQLGERSFPVPVARRLLGGERLIGRSVHSAAAAWEAVAAGADFVIAGPLFETASHPGQPPAGLDWLGPLRELGRPVIGIGGITPHRVQAALDHGCHGVAVVSGIWSSASVAHAVAEYLTALE